VKERNGGRTTRQIRCRLSGRSFRGVLWTRRAAIAPATISAIPALAQFGKTANPIWLVVSVGFAAIAAVWWLGPPWLVGWRRSRHTWPVFLRRLVVLAVGVVTIVAGPALIGEAISVLL
jgi:hypothetical protein